MNLEQKKCLVTGGAGFIGSHLVDALIAKGCQVRVLDNLANGNLENIATHIDNSQLEFVHGSVTDPIDVQRATANIDIVFHLACLGVRHSLTHPFENHKVNAEGTLLMLHFSQHYQIQRYIHCSSSEVYGTAQSIPMSEDHPTCPCTVYGASKLAGERYAYAYYKSYGLPVTIIRPFNSYGPRSHYNGDAGEVIPKFIVSALAQQPLFIFGDGKQTRDFTYVENTVQAIIMAAENDKTIGKTLNIGNNSEISIGALAKKILMLTKSTSKIEHLSARPGDVSRLYSDISQFQEICNWKNIYSLETGLQKTIDFFKSCVPTSKQNHFIFSDKKRNWENIYDSYCPTKS